MFFYDFILKETAKPSSEFAQFDYMVGTDLNGTSSPTFPYEISDEPAAGECAMDDLQDISINRKQILIQLERRKKVGLYDDKIFHSKVDLC